jgi:hypothetical protein
MNGELFVHSYVPTRGRPENLVVRRIKYGELNGSGSAVNFSVRTYECKKLPIGVAISKIESNSPTFVRSQPDVPQTAAALAFSDPIWPFIESTQHSA